jgi:hypothetical protein
MIDPHHTSLRLVRRHLAGKCKFLKSEKWHKFLTHNPDKKTIPENWLSGCSCPIHIKGIEMGIAVRESLDTNILSVVSKK